MNDNGYLFLAGKHLKNLFSKEVNMALKYVVSSLVILGFFGGCAAPKTPDELRQHVRNHGSYTKLETFVVQRPYSAVVQSIQKKSADCLDRTFRHTAKTASLLPTKETDMGTTSYVPVSKIGPTRAEFYTKWVDNTKGNFGIQKGDQFIFYVADVTPKGSNATSIDLYYYTHDRYNWARDFLKAWARGEDPGCPKFTGFY
jgi:hypothetical protein